MLMLRRATYCISGSADSRVTSGGDNFFSSESTNSLDWSSSSIYFITTYERSNEVTAGVTFGVTAGVMTGMTTGVIMGVTIGVTTGVTAGIDGSYQLYWRRMSSPSQQRGRRMRWRGRDEAWHVQWCSVPGAHQSDRTWISSLRWTLGPTCHHMYRKIVNSS